ncbi:MAG: NADH-quinone oxidoreductase subunit NuoE [Planctomycetota bacterium]|jgi:NADH-quinone oxidoreductase subunit E
MIDNADNHDIEAILAKHPGAGRDALIPVLQEIQNSQGYLSREAVRRVGKHLKLPASKVFGVATFYNQFRFRPKGRYHILVCRGTACHVKGSAKVLDAICKYLKIEPGRTTRDKVFSLEVVACMGACALSPVMCVNEDYHAKVSPAKVVKLLEAYKQEAMAAAPQG